MKVIFNSNMMREADSITIRMLNSNGIILMEHAGTACVKALLNEFWGKLKEKRVVCFAGKGNNGGDAVVIARQLSSMGIDVKLVLLADPKDYRGDAAFQVEIIKNYPVEVSVIKKEDIDAILKVEKLLEQSDIVVDGIFGTGLSKPVTGFYADIIELINEFDRFVLSVDIPSGLFADKNTIDGAHIKADLTVTFGKMKPCHVLYPASEECGKVLEDWITIPDFVVQKIGCYFHLVEREDIKDLRKNFSRDSHKGTFGHIGVISGERGKLGASMLAAFAGLKAGCGLSTVFIEEDNYPLVSSIYPEVMFFTTKVKNDEDSLNSFLEGKKAVLIGQGLGVGEYQRSLIKKVISLSKVPIVLDADVFRNFNIEQLSELLRGKKAVLTPHPGEMALFTEVDVKEVQSDRISIAKKVSLKTGAVVILKGYQTVIADKENVFVNTTGSNALGTAGSGDVLGGVVVSLLAQGYSLRNAAILGVAAHGLAGELAEKEYGREGVVAGNLIENISKALNYDC